MATAFGEINGVVKERIENLTKLLKTAKLPYALTKLTGTWLFRTCACCSKDSLILIERSIIISS